MYLLMTDWLTDERKMLSYLLINEFDYPEVSHCG